MKVLFAIKALNDANGGAERVLADITSGLADKGHSVATLSFDHPGGKSFYPLNKKVHRIPLGIGNVGRKATFREVISRMLAIRRAAIRMQPDVVVAFMHSTFIPASFAMIGTGVPIIASEHTVPDHYRWWEHILLLISRSFVRKITVLSQPIIDRYSVFLRSKMVAVANPVQPAKQLADCSQENSNRNVILNIGHLVPLKGQETLIRAFYKIAWEYPNWHLKIIGEGPLRSKLENIISELNLNEQISLPGKTLEIQQEYQDAHIFALPSKYESFGLATAEAMAHGLPAIGFASCPGTNTLIDNNKNGLLIDGDDRIEALSQGLKILIDDRALRKKMGEKGVEKVKQFHPDRIVKEWEDLIKTL